MQPKSNECRLCGARSLEAVTSERRDGLIYHIARCANCEVIQTMEQRAAVSPTYVDIEEHAIDEHRLWCQGQHKLPAFRQWYSLVQEQRQRGNLGPLLDVGCGTGGFLRFAADSGFESYGFDASEAQVKHALKTFPNVRRAFSPKEYVELLGQPSREFRLVTMWDVLEHLRTPREFLVELREVMETQGLLFVSVPSGGAMRWKLLLGRLRGKAPELVPWEHVFYHSPRSLRFLLEQSGFEVLHVGSVACYPRPLSAFELLRRLGFAALRVAPRWAPQIYALGRVA